MTIFINYFLTNLLAKWFNLWGEYNSICSVYHVPAGVYRHQSLVLIVTEADRSCTTVLFESEF